MTDGEDHQFVLDGELEDEDDDYMSWEGHDSSKEKEDDKSTGGEPDGREFPARQVV
jgi:hypothetical protein